MINFDKYITTQPNDGFDEWCDQVVGTEITHKFYAENEDWLLDYDGECNKWMNKLFNKNKLPYEASRIIERAFRITKIN
jgi:hypothetical protein